MAVWCPLPVQVRGAPLRLSAGGAAARITINKMARQAAPRSEQRTNTMSTTDRDAFLTALAHRLVEQGHPADVPDLALWVDSYWPLIEEAPDVERWADEYLQALAGAGNDQ